MKKSIKPRPAKPGDLIGVYSPSGAISQELRTNYERGKNRLQQRGYRILEAPHTFESKGHYSANGKSKSDDLMSLVMNPEVKVILPTIGGTTAYQILEELDYELISRNPKMIFGFSDNSLQACVITQKTGLVTFHAQSDVVFGVGDLGDAEKMKNYVSGGSYTEDQFFAALEGKMRVGPVKQATKWRTLKPGVARGKLMGGNLDVLQMLHGTPYRIDFRGAIFFWEFAFLDLHRLDLALASFALTGALAEITGMVVGKGGHLRETFYQSIESFDEIILRHCKPFDFPIVADADIGHEMECCALPNGLAAQLEGEQLLLLETPYLAD